MGWRRSICAAGAEPALLIGLSGELGAGKTTLVAGLLAGLGHEGPVRSPTYTLIEPYRLAGRDLYHCDLYRLRDPAELDDLGLRDLAVERSVLLVEWPERAGDRLGKPWVVGIRDPRKQGAVVARIPLQDEAISTSGDYERYFEEDGKRYHHILVPGTGKSPDAVRSVTVIGANATRTDGLTKTVFILGVERGMEFVRKLGDVEAVIVDRDGQIFYSAGLEPPH